MTIPRELTPTAIVATTVLVEVSITETELEPAFVTYARDPSGVKAIPAAFVPTGTVAITLLVAVSTTEMELEKVFAT
jgi:hypothetical protein